MKLYLLKETAPKGLKHKFSNPSLKAGVAFINRVPVVDLYPEYFDRVIWGDLPAGLRERLFPRGLKFYKEKK